MRWLITLTLLVSMAASADTYRWVDEDGVVNYSDIPHLGAERIELGQVQTTPFAAPAQRPAPPSTSGSGSGSGDDGAAYQSISIQRPKPEETLWNIEGRLDVAVSVQPGLNASHRLALYLDGQAVAGIPAGATSFTIDKVYRGMHTLRAAVRDSGGRELGSSQAMRFYVQQTSGDNKKSGPTPSPRPRPRS
jgi:hypothetical protein